MRKQPDVAYLDGFALSAGLEDNTISGESTGGGKEEGVGSSALEECGRLQSSELDQFFLFVLLLLLMMMMMMAISKTVNVYIK